MNRIFTQPETTLPASTRPTDGQANARTDACDPSASIIPGATALVVPVTSEASSRSREDDKRRSARDWQEAEALAALCRDFLRLRKNYSLNQAARALGKSPSMFSGAESILARFERGGVAALLPRRGATGAQPKITVPDWFIPAAQFYYLLTNRNRNCGSVPEAIRRVISLPHTPPGWDYKVKARLLKALALPENPVCPVELRELILARERDGKPMLPPRLMRQISASPSAVRQYRNPKNASLDYLNSPGTTMWITGADGSREFIRAGDILEADDGSINFPCCVPWTIGGCPTSNAFKVKVGRFQFLRTIDAASRFRPGYVYVMRPRGSYRQEDILALILGVTRKHGKWRRFRFERGSWKGNRIKEVAALMGTALDTVYSPHSKPYIEGGFNQDWTKLSPYFPNCDIGRFMGETEEANRELVACQQGHSDPRKTFPMLADVIAAFDAITLEENQTPVNSANYGRWIPQERWDQQRAEQEMEPLDPETTWMFAPWVGEWTVKGMLVGGKVRLFEELSVPFDFSAPFLPKFDGAKVKCYFDPFEPRCSATIVLQQNWGAHRAGEVLGSAIQINEVAGYARLVMGWADDPVMAGHLARQQAAAAMRREVRAIMPTARGSKPDITGQSEVRDGVATVAKADIGTPFVVPPSGGPAEPSETQAAAELARRIAESIEFERTHALDFI